MKMFSLLLACLFTVVTGYAQESIIGAWKAAANGVNQVLLITPDYFSITAYEEKKFLFTMGGTWRSGGSGQVEVKVEFNTDEKSQVGAETTAPVELENGQLVTYQGGAKTTWTRIDNGTGPLAGYWKITGRESDGKMNTITPGARKTVKILSGTRFQWIAINTDTGEFFGTGGGTYTFQDGAYTENIDFFSRDNTRVGASLSFKGKVEGNSWDHSGLSSKGEAIHEIWSK
ncbi:membrane or secreted protein [Chitinophaga sp. Mgbs1]|uniref:Membrane or secreted protein n=1 Tax=Chitinophaga solisilvae TaxID=1233460 RepID=A0A9Q5D1F3_9BACT|nr:membrane or secreted protein [Chitinophaga solisilvae]